MSFLSWMVVIALSILVFSAAVKIGPKYLEYNGVRSMMDNIAMEPEIKQQSATYVYKKLDKYMDINGMADLQRIAQKKRPFKLSLMKKGNNRKRLSVQYEVRVPWVGNLSYLIDFKYAVILGEKE
ncbi:MAG: DUF4845 domain-containing protein [Cocleimonas sp.]|nr:DUF4845 domain-containing protein [Cocleimonas sp.]